MKSILLTFVILLLAPIAARSAENPGGFLFVTFHGEATPMTEQIYFGLSKDGRQWEALNQEQPVLISKIGEKGVRDPYIFRSHDGRKIFLIATDLSFHLNHKGSWPHASKEGSQSIVIWESTDLVHWSEPRLVKVAPPDAGCTWAPEATYDERTGDYLVFWASTTKPDHEKQRIWASRTRDFRTFGKPFLYIEKEDDIIDTDIVRENGKYYRFSKNELTKCTLMETSDQLMGPWQVVEQFSLGKMRDYEGPTCFVLQPAAAGKPATWCLMVDRIGGNSGYVPFTTEDLAGAQFAAAGDIKFPFLFRHGSVLPVTAAEFARLQAAYSKAAPAK